MACPIPSGLPDIADSGLTVAHCRAHLKTWLACLASLAENQSYRIGDFEYRRADLGQVREMIKFWQNQERELSAAGTRGTRTKVLRHGW